MCGIVGYIGSKEVKEVLLEGLSRLEYRGYDSSGLAINTSKGIEVVRSVGKLQSLKDKTKNDKNLIGNIGIGHTRWATHGKPTEINAHPHKAGGLLVVHNGIVENYLELKNELGDLKKEIKSETDTEVLAQLIRKFHEEGLNITDSVKRATQMAKGTYALLIMHEHEPDRLYAAKNGSPMVVALGENENFVASDMQAVLSYTKKFFVLDDGDFAILKRNEVKIFNKNGNEVNKEIKHINWNIIETEKGGFKHFMLKEIFEQPQALINTLTERFSADHENINLPELDKLGTILADCNRIYLVACGTAYHASLIGKYIMEELLPISVEVDIASEFRYRNVKYSDKPLAIFVSQSGETLDTLAALKNSKAKGVKTLTITNVMESSIAREADAAFYTFAGPEIGVASTKAFICQIAALYLLTLEIAKRKKVLNKEKIKEHIHELLKIPNLMTTILDKADYYKNLAQKCREFNDVLFIGRNISFPVALEAALKLKEISYIHAEGYAGGELKHGPIAIINDTVLVVSLIPEDQFSDKIVSNMLEVKARDATILTVTNKEKGEFRNEVEHIIDVPICHRLLSPLLFIIPLQLFAYYRADHLGLDIDKPRNLAKSVTVE